jgi:hypothetical protein
VWVVLFDGVYSSGYITFQEEAVTGNICKQYKTSNTCKQYKTSNTSRAGADEGAEESRTLHKAAARQQQYLDLPLKTAENTCSSRRQWQRSSQFILW